MAIGAGRTLRGRFGWRAFLVALAVLEVTTISVALYTRAQLFQNTREALTSRIFSIEDTVTLELASGLDPFASGNFIELSAPDTWAQVLSSDGDVLAASPVLEGDGPIIPIDELPTTPRTTTERTLTHDDLDRSLAIGAALETDGRTYAVIAITSLAEIDRTCRVLCLYVPIAGVAVAALIGFAVAVSVSAALRPVRRVSESAAAMSKHGRPEQLQVSADTTELQELVTDLDRLLEAIRAAFDREQQFLDDASHELRTPIAIARTELDLALRGGPDPDTAKALESARDELRRLDQMASDLLVLARERAGDSGPRQRVDLGAVAQRAASSVRRDPRQRRIRLHVEGVGTVMGDPDSLERALTNLIANAATYCSEAVEVRIETKGDQVITTVTDDGPGIAEHLIDNLFDRFTRARTPQAHSTGLGTAIAAEVVRRHGGAINAHNRDEGGAVVTVSIPSA